MGKKFGFSHSWKRASGLSAMKGRISRNIGVPLTRGGRQRKYGRAVGCCVPLAFLLTAIIVAAGALAEPLSAEDAAAKLREREKARTATSQPSEADELRAMIRKLQVQVAALKEENNDLRVKLADAKKKIPGGAAPGIADAAVVIKAGMKLDEAIAALGKPEHITTRGDGSRTVEWRSYGYVGTGGGGGTFSAAGASGLGGGGSRKITLREVIAEVDKDGMIKDFTDSK